MPGVDDLVGGCVSAVAEPDPMSAVREVLERAIAGRALVDSLGPPRAGLQVLHHTAGLTVLNVVWPPSMALFPHDHRMWAAIGIYAGREDNAFYRRSGATIAASGGAVLVEGDVQLLGSAVIHAVTNPGQSYTGAIHVYGGDFMGTPRSQWDPGTFEERPYDLEEVRGAFARADERAGLADD